MHTNIHTQHTHAHTHAHTHTQTYTHTTHTNIHTHTHNTHTLNMDAHSMHTVFIGCITFSELISTFCYVVTRGQVNPNYCRYHIM